MEKRSPLTSGRQLGHATELIIPQRTETNQEIDTLDIQPQAKYNKNDVNRVRLQLKFPARVSRTGLISGEQYTWEEAGAVVNVLQEDVEHLLQLKIGETVCCGGSPNFLFEKV